MKTIGQVRDEQRALAEKNKEARAADHRQKLEVIEGMNIAAYEPASDTDRTDYLESRRLTRSQIKAVAGEWVGIACDFCGVELYRFDFSLYLSNPPQKKLHCPGCGKIEWLRS